MSRILRCRTHGESVIAALCFEIAVVTIVADFDALGSTLMMRCMSCEDSVGSPGE